MALCEAVENVVIAESFRICKLTPADISNAYGQPEKMAEIEIGVVCSLIGNQWCASYYFDSLICAERLAISSRIFLKSPYMDSGASYFSCDFEITSTMGIKSR